MSDSGRISIFSDADADGQLDTITAIVEGLVSLEYWGHSNNGIAFGPYGALYVLEYNHAVVYRIYSVGSVPHESTSPQVTSSIPGETIFLNGANDAPACVTCHLLYPTITGIGPSLVDLRDLAEERVQGLDDREYVCSSILYPNAYIVEGYTANLMYQDYGKRLSEAEIEALIDYVLSLSSKVRNQ